MTWAEGWFPDTAFHADPPRRPCRGLHASIAWGDRTLASPCRCLRTAPASSRSRGRSGGCARCSHAPSRVMVVRCTHRGRSAFARRLPGCSTLRALSGWKSLPRRPPTEGVPRRDLRHDRPVPTPTDRCVAPWQARRHVDRRPPDARPAGWVRAHVPYVGTPFAVLPSSTFRKAIEAETRTSGDANSSPFVPVRRGIGNARRASTRTSDLRD